MRIDAVDYKVELNTCLKEEAELKLRAGLKPAVTGRGIPRAAARLGASFAHFVCGQNGSDSSKNRFGHCF